jgi:hypothetical protein
MPVALDEWSIGSEVLCFAISRPFAPSRETVARTLPRAALTGQRGDAGQSQRRLLADLTAPAPFPRP